MKKIPITEIFSWPRHCGAELCVALANSNLPEVSPQGSRRIVARPPRLAGYADLVALGRQTGVIAPPEAGALRRMAAEQPELAASIFDRALEMRTFLARLLNAMAQGRRPSEADVEAVDAYLAEVPSRLRIVTEERRVGWHLEGDSHIDRVIWVIASSAAELLLTNGYRRVRQCADKDCRILFYDRSNAQKRRWCDMRTCGNVVKGRRVNDYRLEIRQSSFKNAR